MPSPTITYVDSLFKRFSSSRHIKPSLLMLEPSFVAPDTGTTVVAVVYKEGVVLGADSRVTTGAYVSNRASEKITPLAEDIWLLRSGSAADTQAIADYVRHLADQQLLILGTKPTVKSIAELTRQVAYNNKQLSAALLIAGWDNAKGAQIYCIPIGGTIVEEQWAADGSGSIFLLGLMDARYRKDLKQDEAEKLVLAALSCAVGRDGSSGGNLRLITCNSTGSVKKIQHENSHQLSWDEGAVPLLEVRA